MKARWTLMPLLFAMISLTYAQERIIVRMPGESRENFVTPRALVSVTGHHWIDEPLLAWPDGVLTLGGYFVQLDDQRCLITQINSESIVFIVPETVSEGTRRTLWIQGPQFVRFLDVKVERFWPRLNDQGGFAVAFAGLFPVAFIGESIPVSQSGFNYVSMLVAGFLTGRLSEFGPVLTLQREGEKYELAAEVYEVPGFAGTERLAFWAPPCANGEYQASVTFAGYQSNAVAIRFVSQCLEERLPIQRAIRPAPIHHRPITPSLSPRNR